MEEIHGCTSTTQWCDQVSVPSQRQLLFEDKIAWAVTCGSAKRSPGAPSSANSGKAAGAVL